jgi:CBS domain-containing protein
MELIITGVLAQKTTSPARAVAASVAGVMRPQRTTVTQYDHAAAAAYLMKHTGTTALIVTNAQTGQPAGIITEADIARAVTDGKDLNDVRVQAVMTTRAVRSVIWLGWSLAFGLPQRPDLHLRGDMLAT